MKRPIVVLFLTMQAVLVFNAVCFATDRYVATDGANTGAGAEGAPWLTLDYAYTNSTDGDTVFVAAGTYAADATLELDLDKAVTFRGTDEANISTNSNWGCVRATVTGSTKKVSFINFNFGFASGTGNRFIYWDADTAIHLYFEDCDFDATEDEDLVDSAEDTTGLRKLEFVNCTHSAATANPYMTVFGARLLRVEGCTFTDTNTSGVYSLFNLKGLVHSVIIKDNILTSVTDIFDPVHSGFARIEQFLFEGNTCTLTGVGAGPYYGIRIPDDPVRGIIIIDNTFEATAVATTWFDAVTIGTYAYTNNTNDYLIAGNYMKTGVAGLGVAVNTGLSNTGIIANNYMENFYSGVQSFNSCDISYNKMVNVNNGIIHAGRSGVSIMNNTIIINDHSQSNSRCVLLNRYEHLAHQNDTTFAATTVTFASASLPTFVDGMVALVCNNDNDFPFTHYGLISAIDDDPNTVTVDEWRQISDDTVETPTDTKWCTIVTWPRNVYMVNNVFDGTLGQYAMTNDFAPFASVVSNNNVWIAGTSNMSILGMYLGGNGPVHTLAELQARWGEFNPSFFNYLSNDLNSLDSIPSYVDSCSGDFAECPTADLTGDCYVGLADLAVVASRWMTGTPGPQGMVFVYIDDPGVSGHEGFNGHMSKYETTNAQYSQYLNSALADGEITVYDNRVYATSDTSHSQVYLRTYAADSDSQITYSGGVFSVRTRDSHSMADHPVVEVSWDGAWAFCEYYGYRLPTDWEWRAVADYDGSYPYGCGTNIDTSKANYDKTNPLALSSEPSTSPVGHYPAYGYGMHDMAGNVMEWTSSYILHGGSWDGVGDYCTVSYTLTSGPGSSQYDTGFRVCR